MASEGRQTTILNFLKDGDFHQAEMYIKSTSTRLLKDKKYDAAKTLITAVVETLKEAPPRDLIEVI